MDYLNEALKLRNRLCAIREDLHRHPELGNHEIYTSSKIAQTLTDLGLQVFHPVGPSLDTALVAVLRGSHSGKTVALRAELDALPIQEATICPFSSQNPGQMHACGHDIHMTASIGAAMLLAQNSQNLHGNIIFLFQPDEEGSGGAQRLLASGALNDVSAVFGGHVSPDLPLGDIGIKYGKFYAASDMFKITIYGKSCHGATPERGVDALRAACQIVSEITSLKPSSKDKAVVSVGKFSAGTAINVISDTAQIQGIVRTLGDTDRQEILSMIQDRVGRICSTYGASFDIQIIPSYSGIVNSFAETALLEQSAKQVLGDDKVVILTEPTMTTEDFGYYISAKSGSFCHIGAGCSSPLHSSTFLPDIGAAITASAVYAHCLASYLSTP